MSDRPPNIPDVPTGPGDREHHRDAPDLPHRDAGRPPEGNLVEHGPAPAGHAPTTEPQKGRSSQAEAGETAAEAVVDSLNANWRITKGSDPDAPVAGLLAAAAATNGPLDADAYRRFRSETSLEWPTVEDLEGRYGSFQAALAEAGITSCA